jgi:hypothetical protein
LQAAATTLTGRHDETEILLDRLNDLIGERVLPLGRPVPGDEEFAVWIGVEAWQNVLAVPAKPTTGDAVVDFGEELVPG